MRFVFKFLLIFFDWRVVLLFVGIPGDFEFLSTSIMHSRVILRSHKVNCIMPNIGSHHNSTWNHQKPYWSRYVLLKSGICSRPDFHLEVRNNKPILFLHNVSKNMNNLALAVRFFKLILQTDHIDLSNKEIIGNSHICTNFFPSSSGVFFIYHNGNLMPELMKGFIVVFVLRKPGII